MRSRRGGSRGRTVSLAVCAAVLAFPAASTARGLQLGFADPIFASTNASIRADWLGKAVSSHADSVGISAAWSGIAPTKPANPTMPRDSRYQWAELDAAVRSAAAQGFRIIIQINHAPAWAEGKHRDAGALPGTWKPSPARLGDFAIAIAKRYSGKFDPTPGTPGGNLPRIRYWQVWGEPNLFTNLTPQWKKRNGRYRMISPAHYRAMLNAAYAGLKSVDRSNVVITGGTGPFGDPYVGGLRIQPVAFWRAVFCLKANLKPRSCPGKVPHLDGLAHDPYSVGRPSRKARNADDVTIPDIGKLKRVVRAARKHDRIAPRTGTDFWVTEVSWDSNPPDPDGVPERLHANYLADTFHLLWRQGVSEILWFLIRDQAPVPDYGSTYQSGVYLQSGAPKLAQHAFRFPFTADRVGSTARVKVWGRAPSGGTVQIQRLQGSEWTTIGHAATGSAHVFHATVSSAGQADLRASIGGERSLPRRP